MNRGRSGRRGTARAADAWQRTYCLDAGMGCRAPLTRPRGRRHPLSSDAGLYPQLAVLDDGGGACGVVERKSACPATVGLNLQFRGAGGGAGAGRRGATRRGRSGSRQSTSRKSFCSG